MSGTRLTRPHSTGKKVWWHSSAHILGECCERHYGCHLAMGPPTDDGFFYEMGMNGDRSVPLRASPGSLPLTQLSYGCSVVQQSDYDKLETLAKGVVKDKQKFERLVVSKENLLKMFSVRSAQTPPSPCPFRDKLTCHRAQYNPFKLHFIKEKVPDGGETTVYRCGPMIDLCVGPHIPHTGRVKSLAVLKVRSDAQAGYDERLTKHSCAELVLVLPRRQEQRVAPAHLRHLVP